MSGREALSELGGGGSLRGLEFALGEAARGPLGDIREWGGVAWAKLGSCCWRQWPWYDLYNESRARRGERSTAARFGLPPHF